MMDTSPGPGGVRTDDSIDALFASRAANDAKKKRRPRESSLQETIVDYLNSLPGVFAMTYGAVKFRASYRDRRTGALHDRFVNIGRPGVSDVIGWQELTMMVQESADVRPHRMTIPRWIAIEVKRPGEKPKPHQQRFLDCVEKAGGIAFVARSVADVKAVFSKER